MTATVARFPRWPLTRLAARLRARLRRRQLDAALAAGADPWSSADLMIRASRLGSWAGRQELAAELEALVVHAEHGRAVIPSSQPRPLSPCLRIRCGAVLEQRDTLLALAARARDPEPIDVGVVATLAWLSRAESSPVYQSGDPRLSVAATAARCLGAVERDVERR